MATRARMVYLWREARHPGALGRAGRGGGSRTFAAPEGTSLDFGILEKAPVVCMVPLVCSRNRTQEVKALVQQRDLF
jgi:hypothetical protein